jgi:glutamyl-tRNA reductase
VSVDGAALLCVGPSHKTASLAARERFALVGSRARDLCAELHAHPDVLEVVSVATCNRSELYVAATNEEAVLPLAVASFARFAEADPEELSTMLAVRSGRAAAEHLLRVAAGVESVVVGEAQIQGQLKQALEHALVDGTCGPLLDRLFRLALETGKRVRTETRVGEGRASVGSVAAELVAQRLGGLEGRRVLVVGAGKMGELAVRSLRDRGAEDVYVANRNPTRAAHVAEQCGVTGVGFDQLVAHLGECDAVVSSTNAPHAVITTERVEAALPARAGRPLVVVDLAVPRDVEPGVGALPGCHLFDLDDLEHVVSETLGGRERELGLVHDIVTQVADEFQAWRREQAAVPAIVAMREAAETLRRAEFERWARRCAHMAPEDRARVEQLTRSIVNRMLHEPTLRLREAAQQGEAGALTPPPAGELLGRALEDALEGTTLARDTP